MNTPTRSAAIYGASGYTGAELFRYLSLHPQINVTDVYADSNAGRRLSEVHPHLVTDLILKSAETKPDVDIAFLALPHGAAASTGAALLDAGIKVVDLSADWRLRTAADYSDWYGWDHPAPADLGRWTYGLPEVHRTAIAGSVAVANPGCYPTAAILALHPLLKAGAIKPEGIVISAVSGISGAGRKVETTFLYSELESSVNAYAFPRHRHTPEIEQELSGAAGKAVKVSFVPHLVPMPRGMLATCVGQLSGSGADVMDVLRDAYDKEAFVHVIDTQPKTKFTNGSNHAFVTATVDQRTSTVVVTCAIDNLGKGAAGQAVQNANLMLGFDEELGLTQMGIYP